MVEIQHSCNIASEPFAVACHAAFQRAQHWHYLSQPRRATHRNNTIGAGLKLVADIKQAAVATSTKASGQEEDGTVSESSLLMIGRKGMIE
jgi:hypothetical protein